MRIYRTVNKRMKKKKKDRHFIRFVYESLWRVVKWEIKKVTVAYRKCIAREKNIIKRSQIMKAKQRVGSRRKRAADFFLYERSLRTTASPTDSLLPAVINVRKTDAMSDYG